MGEYQTDRTREHARLERSRVRLLLGVFGLQADGGKILAAHEDLTGKPDLSLLAFDAVFPGFPLCLETRPLYALADHTTCSQSALFRDFRQSVPHRHFQEVLVSCRERARQRPIGLVYRWSGIRHGLIIHNGDFPTTGFKELMMDGTCRVTVERLYALLRTLAAAPWTRESFTSEATCPQPAVPPTPWQLARRIGDQAELRLSALAVHILFYADPAMSRTILVCRDGKRWISVSEAWLAGRLKCSVRTVQRAIAGLKRKRLIDTGRGDYNQLEFSWEGFE